MDLPQNYSHTDNEKKWMKKWDEQKTFAYDPNVSRDNTFVVDTPPPTVSGSLHMGHVFSYTQTDVIARFHRMQGKNIFYPMGFDDNGLPTERRVQNLFGVKCDSTVPYNPSFKPVLNEDPKKVPEVISRKNFLEICSIQTHEDEKKYEGLWKNLGLSIDWNQQYATINDHCRKVSQYSFLDLIKKNYAYSVESPTMWDTDFQTAVAQAEVEDRERPGHFYDIEFNVDDSSDKFVISTTRPELLPACIAVVAHPADERFKKYFGKFAVTPLFHAKVPILPAEHADPEKGTGILMICTFGDINDVQYWKKTKLPLRQVLGRDGKLLEVKFGAGVYETLNASAANENYAHLAGLFANQAKKKVVELLSATGQLIGAAKPTMQAVKYYEKGDRPLEFIPTRQWFIKILEFKKELIEQGKKIAWHPEYMRVRYEQWVEGLNQDWCISRQRYFGVPFPVWYPLKPNGEPDYSSPIFADSKKLPTDPMIECPPGFSEADRGKKFIGDPDVMDTWATSSLTPQLSSHWGINDTRHVKLYPADLRPQAHEIIRTWAFYTITKSWMHAREIPWKNIAISGWVVDPDKKKISKSKGNSKVTPESLMETYSADSLRYWASRAKLGSDTIYDEAIFKIGQRFITKMFNASKFVLMQIGEAKDLKVTEICEPVDLSFVSRIKKLVENSEKNFREYDYAAALLETETLFWDFCDNYVEIVKARAYQQREQASGRSAMATLSFTHKAFLRLLAPIMPYITEEVWSWGYAKAGESIHRAAWPTLSEIAGVKVTDEKVYEAACAVLNKVRGEKTIKQKSLKWPVASVVVSATSGALAMIKSVESDLKLAGNLRADAFEFKTKVEGDVECAVTLSEAAE